MAAAQPFIWFIGMVLMSNAMHRAGLAGVPRRTAEPEYNAVNAVFDTVLGSYGEMRVQIAIGGTLLFVSLVMFLVVMAGTLMGRKGGQLDVNGAIPDPLSGAKNSPRVLDNLKLWLLIAIALVVVTYGLPLFEMLSDGILTPGAPAAPV
jgi:cytochrome c oxidase subunit 1